MEYEIRLERHPGRPLAVVRRRAAVAGLPMVIPAACGVVWEVVRSRQLAGAGRHVALYLDDEINLEGGWNWPRRSACSGRCTTRRRRAASRPWRRTAGRTTCSAREAIRRWCDGNGHRRAGPCWEVYAHWRDEWKADPSGITTDVCCLLATGGA